MFIQQFFVPGLAHSPTCSAAQGVIERVKAPNFKNSRPMETSVEILAPASAAWKLLIDTLNSNEHTSVPHQYQYR